MAVGQNVLDFSLKNPLELLKIRFTWMMGWLVRIQFRRQLTCKHCSRVCFLKLGSYSGSGTPARQLSSNKLLDTQSKHVIPNIRRHLEWNGMPVLTNSDSITVADLPRIEQVTKRVLISDIAVVDPGF
jgi:hypothetical protein